MAGTKWGGIKAGLTNRERYGKDYYSRIGAKGGRNGHTGGFASNPELAREAGRKGGLKSRRGKAKPKEYTLPQATEDDIKKHIDIYGKPTPAKERQEKIREELLEPKTAWDLIQRNSEQE